MRDAPFEAAADLFVDLVARVPDDAWGRPALGVWDVRALVGHTSRSFVTVLTYLDEHPQAREIASPGAYYGATVRFASAGGTVGADAIVERGREAGRALGTDPLAAVRDLRGRALARLADAGPGDLMGTIVGGIRVADYLPTRVLELVVHSRDLARALDLDLAVPDDLYRAVLTTVADAAVETGRADVVVDALLGRGTLPQGFSLV